MPDMSIRERGKSVRQLEELLSEISGDIGELHQANRWADVRAIVQRLEPKLRRAARHTALWRAEKLSE